MGIIGWYRGYSKGSMYGIFTYIPYMDPVGFMTQYFKAMPSIFTRAFFNTGFWLSAAMIQCGHRGGTGPRGLFMDDVELRVLRSAKEAPNKNSRTISKRRPSIILLRF